MKDGSNKVHQTYVSKIGSEIACIDEITLFGNLQILNLHGNKITKIIGLDKTPFLKSLDLSGNQIRQISGLEYLNHLRHLNLACNLISQIESLSNQRSLKVLNLSYNDIYNIDGLSVFSGEKYSLECLLLHGNQISGIDRFVSTVRKIEKLKKLTLSYDGVSNPICLEKEYQEKLLKLKQVEEIDGRSRKGKQIQSHNEYIDALFPSDETNDETMSSTSVFSDPPSDDYHGLPSVEPCRDTKEDQFIGRGKWTKRESNIEKSPNLEEEHSIPTKLENVDTAIQTDPREEANSSRLEIIETDDPSTDEKNRDLIFGCYKALTSDLERERDRRCEAEKCNTELGNVLNLLKSKMAKISKQLSKQSSANLELRKFADLHVEKYNEANNKYQQERVLVSQKNAKIEDLISSLTQCKESMTSLQHTLILKDAEIARESANHLKAENEKKIEVKASQRELELVTASNEKQKKQIVALQGVIANRERDFQTQKEGLFSVDSTEFKRAIQDEISSAKAATSKIVLEKDERIKELVRFIEKQKEEYCLSLEKESKQLKTLQKAFESKCYENSEMEKKLKELTNKQEDSVSIISELSNVVKEQQKRHIESTNRTHKLNEDMKSIGVDYENIKHKLQQQNWQNENLKKSKLTVEKKLDALEAVIEGLRVEKALWSKELVSQGAMLSQNRGRIELKLEMLEKELKGCKEREEKYEDTIKIKSKMLEDQTETIRKLKEETSERDREVKNLKTQLVSANQDFESISDELESCKVDLDKLMNRKEELKFENQELLSELKESEESYNEISEKWSQTVIKIEEFEKHFCEAQNSWKEKESKLKNERDRGVSAAELAIKKLREMENSYDEQSVLQKRQFERLAQEIEENKKQEIEKIKQKVV